VSPTFRSLRTFNYRLWASGAFVSNIGTWMQRVAQDWLVLTVLTDHSAIAVGITTGLQFGPMLFFAPFAGVLADRVPKRRVLVVTQAAMGLTALLLGLLVVTDAVRLWHAYLLAFALGVAAAMDGPSRQAFVSEMVPRKDLSNAVGLNSASFHAARIIGPGVAGLMIAWVGTGPVFLINAATFLAVIGSLLGMRPAELTPSVRAPQARGQLRDAVRYVRARPDIMLVMVIIGMVGTFGLNFQLTTVVMATAAFGKGPGEYGLLGSIMAIGSLGGSLLAARRERPTLRLVVGSAFAFGACSIFAALMPTYETFAVALIPVGLSALTLMTSANATVQLSLDPQMRGRVMALYMAIFMGGTPVGSPVIGWIGETFGPRWTILVGGSITMTTAVAVAAYLVRTRRRDPGSDPGAEPSRPAEPFDEAGQPREARQAHQSVSRG
jgi:MFS family permease